MHMKFKKFLMFATTLFVVAFTAISLSSCGDDDNKEKDEPTPDPGPSVSACDDNRILGTWKGKDYDEQYLITFEKDGTLTERCTIDGVTETDTYSYTLKNRCLDFSGTTPTFANTISNPPLYVTFGSGTTPTTMTISAMDGRYSIKFTRQ